MKKEEEMRNEGKKENKSILDRKKKYQTKNNGRNVGR